MEGSLVSVEDALGDICAKALLPQIIQGAADNTDDKTAALPSNFLPLDSEGMDFFAEAV
jgi:hypothetical protein